MIITNNKKMISGLNETLNNADYSLSEKRNYLGMSEIGDVCERRLWYGFRNFTKSPINLRINRLFEIGAYVEEQIKSSLKFLGYHVYKEQYEIYDHHKWFGGHIDGIIELYNNKYLLECKSSNSKYFNSIKKNGFENFPYYQKYYDQSQCYMGYLNLPQCIFAIYCKDTSEILIEMVEFSNDRFEQLKRKAERIILSEFAPPQIIEEDKYYFKTECKWCDYSIICKEPEVYTMAKNDENCLNCSYGAICPGDFKFGCRHPAHAYFLYNKDGCSDYVNMYEKLNEPIEKVNIEVIKYMNIIENTYEFK